MQLSSFSIRGFLSYEVVSRLFGAPCRNYGANSYSAGKTLVWDLGWAQNRIDSLCFVSLPEVRYARLSCLGCLQCPCERFSVQQPENTNTDGKLALLTRVPPHPTFGTLACSRNADCGPGSGVFGRSAGTNSRSDSYLVDPASSHMLVSKIKPCMSKYKPH